MSRVACPASAQKGHRRGEEAVVRGSIFHETWTPAPVARKRELAAGSSGSRTPNVRATMRSLLVVVAVVMGAGIGVQAIDVRVDFDKTFSFESVRTWNWNSPGAGEVKMART